MKLALANLRRLAWIARVLLRHGVAYLLGARLARWPRLARRLPSGTLAGPQRLAAVLEDLGGTFIKLGQMLALQPDILSLAYCNALFDLLDRVPPFGWEDAARVLREETGKEPDELFETHELAPFASASIGQVYRAAVSGRKVAVKVQRPSVDVDFAGDIRLMTAAMLLIKRLRLVRLYWMIEPMNEFVGWTKEELDYRNEARYMRQLRDDARGNAAERVPEVLLATRRVLVAEFLEGTTVLDYLRALTEGDELKLKRLAAQGFDANLFARRMIDNFLGDAFQHGLFHADLHPANLMILPGNVVGYVDFGITGVLSRYSRYHLVAMTLAYTRGDTAGMADAFLKVSTLDRGADVEAFRAGLRRFAEEWYEARGEGSRLRKNFTLVMLDMLRLSRATGIWPERDVIKYIRSAIAIDGLITRFAPGFSVGQHLATVCDRHLRQAAFSTQKLAAWADAATRLMADGPTRVLAALDRAGSAPRTMPEAEVAYTAGGSARPQRLPRTPALPLAAFAFTLALLLPGLGGRQELGWNLFTAGIVLVGASLAMLIGRLRRIA